MIPPSSDVPSDCPEVPAIPRLRMPSIGRLVVAMRVEGARKRRMNTTVTRLDRKSKTAVLSVEGIEHVIPIENVAGQVFCKGTERQLGHIVCGLWMFLTPAQRERFVMEVDVAPAPAQAFTLRKARGKATAAKKPRRKTSRESKVLRRKPS
jgi:hypothetical protein